MLAKFCHNVLVETRIANLYSSVLNQLHDEKKQLNNIVLFSNKKKRDLWSFGNVTRSSPTYLNVEKMTFYLPDMSI